MNATGKLLAVIILFMLFISCKGVDIVDKPAIDFALTGIDGTQIAYSELKGRPVLLYFFASW